MSESSGAPPVSTFVIRFWREWSVAAVRWRGRIEHVQSGQSIIFVDLKNAEDFMRALGVMADDQGRSSETQE